MRVGDSNGMLTPYIADFEAGSRSGPVFKDIISDRMSAQNRQNKWVGDLLQYSEVSMHFTPVWEALHRAIVGETGYGKAQKA